MPGEISTEWDSMCHVLLETRIVDKTHWGHRNPCLNIGIRYSRVFQRVMSIIRCKRVEYLDNWTHFCWENYSSNMSLEFYNSLRSANKLHASMYLETKIKLFQSKFSIWLGTIPTRKRIWNQCVLGKGIIMHDWNVKRGIL